MRTSSMRDFMGVLGNFTSPDPANAGADLYNPQSWNAYAYVLGNPLGNVDPSGMWWCDPDDPSCDPDWPPPFFPPCFFFDCDGGGGGGGNGGGSGGGGTSSNTPRSTPLPPNSFPGGETLGPPPGMRVPLPSPAVMRGLNLNLDCEFGVCVGGVDDFMNPQLNPQQTAQIDAALYALAADFWRGIKVWVNGRPAPGDPYKTRLFGTHWCGPRRRWANCQQPRSRMSGTRLLLRQSQPERQEQL
jgi:hypothetical protein